MLVQDEMNNIFFNKTNFYSFFFLEFRLSQEYSYVIKQIKQQTLLICTR